MATELRRISREILRDLGEIENIIGIPIVDNQKSLRTGYLFFSGVNLAHNLMNFAKAAKNPNGRDRGFVCIKNGKIFLEGKDEEGDEEGETDSGNTGISNKLSNWVEQGIKSSYILRSKKGHAYLKKHRLPI